MKRLVAALNLVLLVLVGCLDQAGQGTSQYKGPLFRYYFVGRASLPPGTNASVYKEIDAMPVTAELRAELAQKLALATLPFSQRDLAPGATDQSAVLRPLLDDLLAGEAFVEVRGPLGRTQSVLAISLDDAKAQNWHTRLRQLATAWKLGTPREVTLNGVKGWEVQRSQAPNTLQFFRTGKWVLLGLGQESVSQLATLLQETVRSGRPVPPSTNMLELSVDLPGWRARFPVLARYPLPAAVASLSARGENLRTEVRFHYSSRIPWKPEPWKIPTHVISEPLTSFTAAQGVAPLLSSIKGLSELGVNPMPNQFCAWGLRHEQCRMYFSVPVAENGIELMNRISVKLPQFILATVTNARGEFFYVSNRNELVWTSLPYLIPVIHGDRKGADNYLVGGNFPLVGKHMPVPDELFAQVRGRTNLVYYDWEITQQRLSHGKQFYQLASMATGRQMPSTNSTSKRWMSAIAPKLGNTATEIIRVGPQELAMVRKSHIGLTGFEIATFSAWLDSSGFPLDFTLPPIMPATVKSSALNRLAAESGTSAPPVKAGSPVKTNPSTNRANPVPPKR